MLLYKFFIVVIFIIAIILFACSENNMNDFQSDSCFDMDNEYLISPDNGNIIYYGRVFLSKKGRASFAYPGITISMTFTGSAIAMLLDDHGSEQFPNFYYIIIDKKKPVKLQVSPNIKKYTLACDLNNGEHMVQVVKLNESGPMVIPKNGETEFKGFIINKNEKTVPATVPDYNIEFIGDSITCGYGNEISVNANDLLSKPEKYSYSSKNENAYYSWGAIAARELNSAFSLVACSGKGVVRNFDDNNLPVMPEIYLNILPESPKFYLWNPKLHHVDLLVLNLGTTDFSEGLDVKSGEYSAMRSDFRHGYVAFIKQLQGYYPLIPVIITAGPMIADDYPEGYNAWTSIKKDLEAVVKEVNDNKKGVVTLLFFESSSKLYGEDWHPTIDTHKKMAAQLVDHIKKHNLLM